MSANKDSAIARNLRMEVEHLDVEPLDAFVVENVQTRAHPTQQAVQAVADELDLFVPTRDMVQTRIRLHSSMRQEQIYNLRVDDIPSITKYAWPVTERTLRTWSEQEGFWPWLVGSDEVDAEMYMLRRKALTTVRTIMDLDDKEFDGVTPNHKNLGLKLQTSKFIMGETNPKSNSGMVINNNILNASPQRKASVRREPIEQLRQRVNKLREANNVNTIDAEVLPTNDEL
jgi:hypothetical protein